MIIKIKMSRNHIPDIMTRQKIIEGFIHRSGVHCESSTIRDLLEFYGLKLSEEMVFGIDGTFGFVYWKDTSAFPPFHIGGKIHKFPRWLPKLLGILVEKGTTASVKRAWESVKNLIDRNIPVLLFVDMYYLDYMEIPREPWNHFGAHMIALAGYDEEREEAYVADSSFIGLQTVPLKNLAEARSSKYKPFPPRNAWFEIHLPKQTKPLDQAVKIAVERTAEDMLNPPTKNFGVKGIRYLAEEITEWPEQLSDHQLRLALFLNHIDIEEAGTGGGNFRKVHSRFLKEVGQLLHSEELRLSCEKLEESGNKWSETARLLLMASKEGSADRIRELLSKASLKMAECADIEEEAFSSLKSLT